MFKCITMRLEKHVKIFYNNSDGVTGHTTTPLENLLCNLLRRRASKITGNVWSRLVATSSVTIKVSKLKSEYVLRLSKWLPF